MEQEKKNDTMLEEIPSLNIVMSNAFKENKESRDKCLEYGNELLERAKKNMDDTMDKEIKSFLSRVKVTVKSMNAKRKPVTQFIDKVKKYFTTLENDVQGETMTQLETLRDNYAKEKLVEANISPENPLIPAGIDIEYKKEIQMKDKKGYADAFMIWWEKSGKDLSDEELEKKLHFAISFVSKLSEDEIKLLSGNIILKKNIKAKK